jgi:hypothetical protein
MSITFPSIKPSSRSFKLGSFPTKVYRALSGATAKRSFGNRPFGYEIQLTFSNIDDTKVSQLLKHYMDTSGGFSRFLLPPSVFAGMDATLQSYAEAPSTIRWEYTGPPEVESVIENISNVQLTLIGEQDV